MCPSKPANVPVKQLNPLPCTVPDDLVFLKSLECGRLSIIDLQRGDDDDDDDDDNDDVDDDHVQCHS